MNDTKGILLWAGLHKDKQRNEMKSTFLSV